MQASRRQRLARVVKAPEQLVPRLEKYSLWLSQRAWCRLPGGSAWRELLKNRRSWFRGSRSIHNGGFQGMLGSSRCKLELVCASCYTFFGVRQAAASCFVKVCARRVHVAADCRRGCRIRKGCGQQLQTLQLFICSFASSAC